MVAARFEDRVWVDSFVIFHQVLTRRPNSERKVAAPDIYLRSSDPTRRAGARIIRQTFHALHPVPLPPLPYGCASHTQTPGDLLVGKPFRSAQNDLRTQGDSLGGLGTPRQQFEFLLVGGLQGERSFRAACSHCSLQVTIQTQDRARYLLLQWISNSGH